MLRDDKLNAVLGTAPTIPAEGNAFRVVWAKYASEPLTVKGAFISGGRYNIAEQFGAIYLADSPVTALLEVRLLIKLNQTLKWFDGPPRTLFSVRYRLNSVLDITNPDIQKTLETNLQELTGVWYPAYYEGEVAPTQKLGAAVYKLRVFEALKVPSSVDPSAYNLIVFPNRLSDSSLVGYVDDDGNFVTLKT